MLARFFPLDATQDQSGTLPVFANATVTEAHG
jgi:hypothetical protein